MAQDLLSNLPHRSLLSPIQPDTKEIEECKVQPSSLLKSGDHFCPKWRGVSPVDELGKRHPKEIFSLVNEVLLSKAVRFSRYMITTRKSIF